MLAASIKKVTLENGKKWTDPRGTLSTKVWTHGRSSQKWKKTKIFPGLYVEMIELIMFLPWADPMVTHSPMQFFIIINPLS